MIEINYLWLIFLLVHGNFKFTIKRVSEYDPTQMFVLEVKDMRIYFAHLLTNFVSLLTRESNKKYRYHCFTNHLAMQYLN